MEVVNFLCNFLSEFPILTPNSYCGFSHPHIKNLYIHTQRHVQKSNWSPEILNSIDFDDEEDDRDDDVSSRLLVSESLFGVSKMAKCGYKLLPSVVPWDSHDGKDNANSRRESVIPARPSTGTSLKPHHVRRPSLAAKFDVERLSVPVESESIRKTSGDKTTDPTFHERLVADDAREDSGKKHVNIDSVARKFEKKLSPLAPPSQENSAGGNPVASKRVGSNTSSKVVHPSDSKEMDNLPTQKQGPVVGVHVTTIGHRRSKCFVVPSVVPRDSHDGKDNANSRRESVIPAKPSTGTSLKPHHVRRPSLAAKFDVEKLSVPVESESIRKTSGDKTTNPTFPERLVADDAREDSGKKHLNIDSVARKFEKKRKLHCICSRGTTAGGNPVASKRVGSNTSSKVVHPSDSKEMDNLPTQKQGPVVGVHAKTIGHRRSKCFVVPSVVPRDSHDGKDNANSRRESVIPAKPSTGTSLKPHHVQRPSLAAKFDVEKLSVPVESESIRKTIGDKTTDPTFHERLVADDAREDSGKKHLNIDSVARKFEKKLSPLAPPSQENCNESLNGTEGTNSVKVVNGVAVVQGRTRSLVERFERRERLNSDEVQAPDTTPQIRLETAKISLMLNGHPQITKRELTSANDGNVAEGLMQNHDVFLSTLQSRLTKLQVVRHFLEHNNIKGAIDATRKLPDHSVQADLISILMKKTEILTLDLFSCLLPVLLGLLDSKMERHASISLEMLLKLVAVFGPVVHSTISASPAVGVDLHAEQRLECCNQCFIQLQKIQKYLPVLVRRGGLLAKRAQDLNVVLQNS